MLSTTTEGWGPVCVRGAMGTSPNYLRKPFRWHMPNGYPHPSLPNCSITPTASSLKRGHTETCLQALRSWLYFRRMTASTNLAQPWETLVNKTSGTKAGKDTGKPWMKVTTFRLQTVILLPMPELCVKSEVQVGLLKVYISTSTIRYYVPHTFSMGAMWGS